jgi:hypothetical protein
VRAVPGSVHRASLNAVLIVEQCYSGRPLITRNDLISVDKVIFKATAADAAAVERQLRLDWKRIEQSVAVFIADKQA